MIDRATTEVLHALAERLAARRRPDAPDQDGERLADVAAVRETLEQRLAVGDPDRPPPRRMATALALAYVALPHLSATLGDYRQPSGEEVREPEPQWIMTPLALPAEALESCFGLANWEIDDLRDEVDRRASKQMKQRRALQWLWSRFRQPQAGPEPLLHALFPDVALPGAVGLVRRGAQLYVVVDQSPPADEAALFLPWRRAPPLRFDPRAVDPRVLEGIARGVGASPPELLDLLTGMVTVIPRSSAMRWLIRDGWRSRGFAALTAFGTRYRAPSFLGRPIGAGEIDASRFVLGVEQRVVVGDPEAVFQQLARPRAEAALQAIYAEMLARVAAEPTDGPTVPVHEDLDLYDAAGWLEVALGPIVAWARDPDVRAAVGARTHAPAAEVTRAMDAMADRWADTLDRLWLAPPNTASTSVAAALLPHLILLHGSLRRLARAPADARSEHRELLLLGAAFDLGASRLDRFWAGGIADAGRPSGKANPPEDLLGSHFWSSWLRLLTHANLDASTLF